MAPKMVSITTEPVVTSTYQPRIRVSISNAHDVSRSAGHWKRKLRLRNGANVARDMKLEWQESGGGTSDVTTPRDRDAENTGLAALLACSAARTCWHNSFGTKSLKQNLAATA